MDKEELFFNNFNRMFTIRNILNKLPYKAYSSDFHHSEVRCIDLIGRMEEANVTKLSEAAYMTRGGISKTIKKLLNFEVIESYQKPDNKKEIYYKLTKHGEDIFLKYEEFRKAQIERDRVVFLNLKEEEKDIVIKFLETFNVHLQSQMDEKFKILNPNE
jgi:DNA-binding MarR family transcriptional regulator